MGLGVYKVGDCPGDKLIHQDSSYQKLVRKRYPKLQGIQLFQIQGIMD